MRCLGTLEFLCDFYERCHATQKELLEVCQNEKEGKVQEDSNEESDKENTAPSVSETKRKTKVSPLDSSKGIKNCLTENTMSFNRSGKKEENIIHIDNNDSINDAKRTAQPSVQLNSIISHEKILKNNRNNTSSLKCRRKYITKKESILKTAVTRTTRSMNDLNLSQKNERNISINLELPIRRKRGRKSKLEKLRQTNLETILKAEIQNNLHDKKNDDSNNECKMHDLRTVCATSESTVISSKPQVEQATMQKNVVVLDTSPNEVYAKANEIDTMHGDSTIINKSTEIKYNEESIENPNGCLKNIDDKCMKSKPISVIVKQEKGETESSLSKRNDRLNQITWIPSDILTQKIDNLMRNQNQMDQEEVALTQITFPLVQETERIESDKIKLTPKPNLIMHADVGTTSDYDLKFTEQNRKSVIKSSQSNHASSPQTIQDSTELCTVIDAIGQNTKSELQGTFSDHSLSGRFNQDSIDKNKSKDRSFAKISELISDEQKQTIETYYTVNMSMVNSEEVQKNITIVDKKNIRCNICGTLYLRMDKCQVHIWGHLQMKPYQCKACDFATVTISNVRCHIRKSHLKIKPFACHLCEKRYVTAILLEEHINTHTGARPYKCKLCDFASSSRQILSYHNATHKPLKDINCKLCGKEFYSKSRLRAHMIVHNKDKAIMCKICSAYLSNAEALETHHRNIHMQDYVCNVCGKHVKSRKALHNHQNVHAAAKYKCTLCPNVYKSSQILKEHLLKHEGIRKYKCNVCEKSFGQQSHLAAHMAVHSKIRFHCPGCDKPFNRQDNMKIHTKRCKAFSANPDLKNLLTKRERTISFNNVTELTAELKQGNISNSIPDVSSKNQSNNIPVKTVKDQQKTAINLCKLGLNISCIKPTDKIWNSDDMYKEQEVARSTEINVIKISNINDRLISENESLSVLENVLGPESY